MKKVAIVFVVLLAVGAAAYFGWRLFRREPPNGTLPIPTPSSPLPPVGAAPISPRLRRIIESPIFSYWINPANDALYYVTDTGEIYRLTLGGEPQLVTTQPIQGLMEVVPSPDHLRALVSFGSREEPLFAVFDTTASRWQPLPAGTRAAAFNPAGDKLMLLSERSGTTFLFEFTLSDAKLIEISRLNVRDVILSWPTTDTIYIVDRPSASHFGSLWTLNRTNKTIRRLIQDERGLIIRWEGSIGLKFSMGSQSMASSLGLINGEGRFAGEFPFLTTLPQKCTLTEPLFVCAVPQGTLLGLPDDYLKRKVYSEDALLAWNKESGATMELFGGEEAVIDAEMLQISNGKLYFLNRYDRRIYEFELPASEETPAPSPTGEAGE